ncbi:MAG: hypothetical protein WAV25_02875 [Minisyncoccia bacterium]
MLEAEANNEELLGPQTLGIEVTHNGLAKRCGLGNIDPQHGKHSRSSSSAIEEALTWPQPPDGSRLVTIRLDKDAIGAMAVLIIRLEGGENKIDRCMVSWIGAIDRHGFMGAVKRYPELAKLFKWSREIYAMDYIIHQAKEYSLAERVCMVASILCHEMSVQEMDDLTGKLRARKPLDFRDKTVMFGKVAFIETSGEYHSARTWGGKLYKVTVVYDALIKRFTLVRQSHCFDKIRFDEEVNKLEAEYRGMTTRELAHFNLEWGGNENITSSPEGEGRESRLTIDSELRHKVVQLAYECLESGVVS